MSHGLFPEEQRGCRQRTRGTYYQGKHNETEILVLAWIVFKKANDMVVQSWIIEFLKRYNISYAVKMFIKNIMENWKMERTAGGKSLAETKIREMHYHYEY